MANETHIFHCVPRQTVLALHDEELTVVNPGVERRDKCQPHRLRTQIMEVAPQAQILPE